MSTTTQALTALAEAGDQEAATLVRFLTAAEVGRRQEEATDAEVRTIAAYNRTVPRRARMSYA